MAFNPETFFLWLLGMMLMPMAHHFFPRVLHEGRFAGIIGYLLGGLVFWAVTSTRREKPCR